MQVHTTLDKAEILHTNFEAALRNLKTIAEK